MAQVMTIGAGSSGPSSGPSGPSSLTGAQVMTTGGAQVAQVMTIGGAQVAQVMTIGSSSGGSGDDHRRVRWLR